MRFEIPEFSRCLICVPLRYGIITFGYLNLLFALFVLAFEAWMAIEYGIESSVPVSLQSASMFMYRGVAMHCQFWFIILLYVLEVAFNIVLLTGAHMKLPKLIRVYYYYSITTTLAAFLCYLLLRPPFYFDRNFDALLIEFCVAVAALFLHVYLILLIRSEFRKLDDNNQVSFINNVAEVYVSPSSDDTRNLL